MLTRSFSDGTIDYQGRQHQIDFVLNPYYGNENLDFHVAMKTLKLAYRDTLLYTERDGRKTTGLDALSVRPSKPHPPLFDPALPIPAPGGRLSVDSEGIALNADGTCVFTF